MKIGPKEEHVKALREARFERWQRPRVTDRELRDVVAKAGRKKDPKSAEQERPWDAEGISRRTYYRRKGEEDARRDSGDCEGSGASKGEDE